MWSERLSQNWGQTKMKKLNTVSHIWLPRLGRFGAQQQALNHFSSSRGEGPWRLYSDSKHGLLKSFQWGWELISSPVFGILARHALLHTPVTLPQHRLAVPKVLSKWDFFCATVCSGGERRERSPISPNTTHQLEWGCPWKKPIIRFLWKTYETCTLGKTKVEVILAKTDLKLEEKNFAEQRDCPGIQPVITALESVNCFLPRKLSLQTHDRPAFLKKLLSHFSREMRNLTVW